MADSIKDRDTFDALKSQGMATGKAAAIANARAAGTLDTDSRPYEARTAKELRSLARERDIAGRSSMRKAELIEALRDD